MKRLMQARDATTGGRRDRVRYAVVGAGHIAQNAVLPAFAGAAGNSELTAVVSGDADRRTKLRKKYGFPLALSYEQYEDACREGRFDAVFIALPNSMHCEFACRAARAGVHVLCEKPLAVTSAECAAMIAAARAARVRLMVAYRLHFESANLRALELVRSGRLGEPRFFSSVFSMQVRPGNIRTRAALGGGPLPDLGVYSINAARCLFGSHPTEAVGRSARGDDARFAEIEEMTTAILRFPGDRLAMFTCSFGASDASYYQVVGSEGDLRVDPAFEYDGELRHVLTVNGKTRERRFPKRDQFAAELVYFSDCVLHGREPEPGGAEGLADVAVIEAIQESSRRGCAVRIEGLPRDAEPTARQEMRMRPGRKAPLVGVDSAHMD